MSIGEKGPSDGENQAQSSDEWQELTQEKFSNQESTEEEWSIEKACNVREILDESDRARLDEAVSELLKTGEMKALFSSKAMFAPGAAERAAEILFSRGSDDDEVAKKMALENIRMMNTAPEGYRGVEALDYLTNLDSARARLAEFSEENEQNFDEIDKAGIEEYQRILQPQPGDDLTRMHFSASALANGTPRNTTAVMIWNGPVERSKEEEVKGEPLLRARIRDLGNFRNLRAQLAEQLGRPELVDFDAVTALNVTTGRDRVLQYLQQINPLMLDYNRGPLNSTNRSRIPVDFNRIENLDPTNLGRLLEAYDGSSQNAVFLEMNLPPDEIMQFSEQEIQNYESFLSHIKEIIGDDELADDDERWDLVGIGNVLMCSSAKNGSEAIKGLFVREGKGEAALKLFDTATQILNNQNDPLRHKKCEAITYMLLSGSARVDQADGFENLFRAMDEGDPIALGLVEDETFPDGRPNPDANKNWSRGFGLGIADYSVACYTSKVTPQNLQRLVLEHDSLPGLSETQYFQNREDSRVLSGDEKNSDELRIFNSRDFIHNEMPHAHEVLVYTWAYQKIGRGEQVSDEERAALRQIGITPPQEGDESQREEILTQIKEKYLDFLEQNEELSDIVIGDARFGLDPGERFMDELSPTERAQRLRKGRSNILDSLSFNLEKYDSSLSVLDTANDRVVEEAVPDILWRLVQNTDHQKIESPQTGDAQLDQLLDKIDLSIGQNGAPVELRDLREVMPYINEKLRAMQGGHELTPQLVDGLSFISRAAHYAVKDLPPSELRELFYDPTFKEVIRFHTLTASGEPYRDDRFDAIWSKFSTGIAMEDDDDLRLEHYQDLNKTILNQVEPLVNEYRGLAKQQQAISEDFEKQRDADRIWDYGIHGRTYYAIEGEVTTHARQAAVERNFANSVWSLNLSSTLAKIGSGLI